MIDVVDDVDDDVVDVGLMDDVIDDDVDVGLMDDVVLQYYF